MNDIDTYIDIQLAAERIAKLIKRKDKKLWHEAIRETIQPAEEKKYKELHGEEL